MQHRSRPNRCLSHTQSKTDEMADDVAIPSRWRGQVSIRGSHEFTRMALLTCSLIGMVFTWSLEYSLCAPYLQELGLTKAHVSLVWTMMPINGIIVQPLVGTISDRSTSRFGRRRPFMIASAVLVGIAIMSIAWSREVADYFYGGKGTDVDAQTQTVTITIAVLSLYTLDMAMSALQAADRGLIVDTLPEEEQQVGAAWDARMGAVGHITAYFIGSLNLVSILPTWLGGNTHFKKMSLICVFALWTSVGATVWAVSERVLTSDNQPRLSPRQTLSAIIYRVRNLPSRIQTICWVQFWTYLGWFPFIIYNTTWIGETYFRYEFVEARDGANDEHVLGKVQRLGSTALVAHAVFTLVASWILPLLVQRKDSTPESHLRKTSRIGFLASAGDYLSMFTKIRPRLVTVWMLSELLFCFIFIWTPFVRSLAFASALVALAGITWQVTVWAPMSEMGRSITIEHKKTATGSNHSQQRQYERVPSTEDPDTEEQLWSTSSRHRPSSELEMQPIGNTSDHSAGKRSGVYLGILQVYTSLPAFLGSGMTWIIFSIFEPKRKRDPKDPRSWLDLDENGSDAISICIFMGALCAAVAAGMAWHLRRMDNSS